MGLSEYPILENPWGTEEELDKQDVLRDIALRYTQEQFLDLPFNEKLEQFNISGTSSSLLFDILLDAGETDYLEAATENERAVFEEFKKKLTTLAESTKENDLAEKVVTCHPSFVRYRRGTLQSLKSTIERFSDKNYGTSHWANNLGFALMIELWDLIGQTDTCDNQAKTFIRNMFDLCDGFDRQFGYVGRRGSFMNTVIMACSDGDGQYAAFAKKTLAYFGMLRNVCRDVTKRNEFWPYQADSKSLRTRTK